MRPLKIQLYVLLSVLVSGLASGQDHDAAEHWRKAFTLSLQGNKFESAKLNELALGSYMESLKQFQFVSENYSEFQTELVLFRIKTLEQLIEEQFKLQTSQSAEITMKYVEYLTLAKQAAEERDSMRHLKSLATFNEAKTKLEDLIAMNPEKYTEALGLQKRLLANEVLRLNQRYVKNRYKAPAVTWSSSGSTYGTTRYVVELPEGDGLTDAVPSLFPGR